MYLYNDAYYWLLGNNKVLLHLQSKQTGRDMLDMAMWHSWLMRQSSNLEVVGSSPADSKKLAVSSAWQAAL